MHILICMDGFSLALGHVEGDFSIIRMEIYCSDFIFHAASSNFIVNQIMNSLLELGQ